MRYVLSMIAAISVSASMACAQVIITPENDTEFDINIMTKDKLSWEEAANHRDIEVVRPTADGLQIVPGDELDASDRDTFLQLREAVRRIDGINRLSDIDYGLPGLTRELEKLDPVPESDEKPSSSDQD